MSKQGPIIAVGVIIVVLFASPFALGMLAESNVRAQVENLDTYQALSFEVTEYDRGWFSSEATVEIRPASAFLELAAVDPSLGGMGDQLVAPFSIEIGHGPILTLNGFGFGSFAVIAGIDPEAEWLDNVLTELDIPYLFELHGNAGFGSGFDFEGGIPPFEIVDDDETGSFSGLEITGNTNGQNLVLNMALDNFSVQGPFESMTIEDVFLDADYEVFRFDTVPIGTGTFGIGRVMMANPLLGADAVTGMEGLSAMGSVSRGADNKLDISALYSVDSVSAMPIPALSDIALGLNFNDIDAEAVDELYALINGIYSNPESVDMMAFAMLPIVEKIIQGEPTLSIDPMRFTMDTESLDAKLTVSINADALPSGQVMELMDPSVALNAFDATLEMTISKELLNTLMVFGLTEQMGAQLAGMTEEEVAEMMQMQVDQSIAMVVAQGMVVDNGDTFSTRIVYENGVADVNGTPIPLNALGF